MKRYTSLKAVRYTVKGEAFVRGEERVKFPRGPVSTATSIARHTEFRHLQPRSVTREQ